MDLQLATRVLWRFKWLVIPGLVLAVVLAALSMVKVNFGKSPHIAFRTQPQYESDTTVFVTTHGFPWGALNLRAGTTPSAPRGTVDSRVLTDLAALYTQLALSNQVMALLKKHGPLDGQVQATQLFAPDSTTLPLIALSAVSSSPGRARTLAQNHLNALQTWLSTSQNEAGTNADNRVVLEPVSGPLPAKLIKGRKKTTAILIFLAVSTAVFGLAFILENIRPRVRALEQSAEPAPAEGQPQPADEHAQRSAA